MNRWLKSSFKDCSQQWLERNIVKIAANNLFQNLKGSKRDLNLGLEINHSTIWALQPLQSKQIRSEKDSTEKRNCYDTKHKQDMDLNVLGWQALKKSTNKTYYLFICSTNITNITCFIAWNENMLKGL